MNISHHNLGVYRFNTSSFLFPQYSPTRFIFETVSTTKKNISILALIPYKVYPAVMGGQKGIALFYKYLAHLIPLTVLTVKKNKSAENYDIINTISGGTSRYANPFLFFSIRNIIHSRNITHLLFEHPYYAWLIFLYKKCSSQRIIVHSHNIESERFKSIGKWWWKILWYYERWAYRNAHYLWFKTTEDRQYAIKHYGIDTVRCHVIPYGVENNCLPDHHELEHAKQLLQTKYNIPANETIMLFNGTLSYKPNADALDAILHHINPLLLQSDLKYKILICGKNLPAPMDDLRHYQDKNIIYAGFVDDIDLYFKGCDIFLNPLQDGGGIKTKLVEALGFGKTCISSGNGAIGVNASSAAGRLIIVPDKDWNAYANAILQHQFPLNDNNNFYRNFSWQQIAEKARAVLNT